MRWRRWIALVLLALLGACSDDVAGVEAGSTTGSTSVETSSTSTSTEPSGEDERIRSVWASLSVEPETGRSQVTEVIEYDFGDNERHGIYRDVPDVDPDAEITASSTTAPDDLLVTPTDEGVRIRIGDPGRTITGVHAYTITFPLDLDPGPPLAWDAIGTEWEVPIDAAEIHITGSTSWNELGCVAGPLESTEPCDELDQPEPGHLVARQAGLAPNEGVTLVVTPGKPLSAAPDPPAPPSA